MKNHLFLLISILALTFGSCEKDSFGGDFDGNSSDEFSKTLGTPNPFDDVTVVSSWLKFQDQRHFEEAYEYLETIRGSEADPVVLTEDDGRGYGASYDDDPALAALEDELGFYSLRKSLQLQEDERLRAGRDPNEILNSLEDRTITSSSERTLWSPDFVIQIGDQIYYRYTKSLEVSIRGNEQLMRTILTDGIDEIYKEENLPFVKLRSPRKGGHLRGDFPCTAKFNALEGGFTSAEKKEAVRSFLWNNGDASGAKDLEIVWDWGDGTTETRNEATASHKYENLAPYPTVNTFNVCATVSYKIEKTDDDGEVTEEQCSESSCETISITLPEVEEETEEDYCDLLAGAIAVWDLVGSPFEYALGGNANQTCVALNGLYNILVDLGIQGNYTLNWTFQGQEGTGVQSCFSTPCDANYLVSIQILDADGNSCVSYTDRYDHNADASCEGKVDISKGWSYQDGYFDVNYPSHLQFRTEIWGKHETNKDDKEIFSSPSVVNQIEAKMKHYQLIDNKWKKSSMHHKIHFLGNVYPQGNGCDCGGDPQYMDDEREDLVMAHWKFEQVKKVFPSQNDDGQGIFCKTTDPYFIHYKTYLWGVERTVQTFAFPDED